MAFDITNYAQSYMGKNVSANETRDIEAITADILRLKEDAGNAILGIGQRLIEAKSMLSHGEWLPWLTERVEFSERAAQRFMRLAKEWRNPSMLSDLGATKALALLALPPEEREQFIDESHIVNGEEKAVADMTSRELERALRERDEARKAAEAAQSEARSAEEGRAKMEADMAALKRLQESAASELAERESALEQVREELRALREKPVDVAVMAVDQEALEKARAEAVAEAQAKLDRAQEAKAKAEEKREAAETALEQTRQELEAARAAGKSAPLAGDKDLRESDGADTSVQILLAGCQEPDLRAPELQEKYGAATPAEAVKALLLPGEIEDLSRAVERLCGYRRLTIDEVKNA